MTLMPSLSIKNHQARVILQPPPQILKQVDNEEDNALAHFSSQQEAELVEFSSHPIFYDQRLADFKNRTKRDRLLQQQGERFGMSGNLIREKSAVLSTITSCLILPLYALLKYQKCFLISRHLNGTK